MVLDFPVFVLLFVVRSLRLEMSIPTLLSLSRSPIGFVIIYLLVTGDEALFTLAAAIMLLAEVSDIADGFIARRFGLVTRLGMIIDPMSDSLYRTSIFLGFMAVGWMPVWFVAVTTSCSIIVAYLRVFVQQQGVTMAARSSGKFKAVVQGAAQISTTGMHGLQDHFIGAYWNVPTVSLWLLGVATAVTAWSALDYGHSFFRTIQKERTGS